MSELLSSQPKTRSSYSPSKSSLLIIPALQESSAAFSMKCPKKISSGPQIQLSLKVPPPRTPHPCIGITYSVHSILWGKGCERSEQFWDQSVLNTFLFPPIYVWTTSKKGAESHPHVSNLRSRWFLFQEVQVHPYGVGTACRFRSNERANSVESSLQSILSNWSLWKRSNYSVYWLMLLFFIRKSLL